MAFDDLLTQKMVAQTEVKAEEPSADHDKIIDLRLRVVKGEPVTREELQSALKKLAEDVGYIQNAQRTKATKKKTPAKKAKKAPSKSAEEILDLF